jgi:hypothetical protein
MENQPSKVCWSRLTFMRYNTKRAYMVRNDSPSDHVRSIMSKLAAKKLVTMDSGWGVVKLPLRLPLRWFTEKQCTTQHKSSSLLPKKNSSTSRSTSNSRLPRSSHRSWSWTQRPWAAPPSRSQTRCPQSTNRPTHQVTSQGRTSRAPRRPCRLTRAMVGMSKNDDIIIFSSRHFKTYAMKNWKSIKSIQILNVYTV